MNKLIGVSVVAVLCHVGVAHAAPDWCKDAKFKEDVNMSDLSEKEANKAVPAIAKAICKPTAEAQAAMAQIEQARQAWGKKLNMTDADWADAVDYAKKDGGPKIKPSTKDFGAMTPMDQYTVINDSPFPPGPRGGAGFEDEDYMADMFEPNLTEVGRLAYIRKCLDRSAAGYVPAVDFAVCQGDLDAWDPAKFATQLRDDKAHAGASKMVLRFDAYVLPKRIEKRAKAVAEIAAKDAGYKKIFDAAKTGRAKWFTWSKTIPDLLALATKMDSATWSNSRAQFDGCGAIVDAAMTKVFAAKVSASMFKDIPKDYAKNRDEDFNDKDPHTWGMKAAALLSDIPEVLFVAGPYLQCHQHVDPENKGWTAAYVSGWYEQSIGMRGPRRAALSEIEHAHIVLDDMSATVQYPKTEQPFETNGELYTRGGVVKSVTEKDGELIVSLQKLMVKHEECITSHHTNRPNRIYWDGTIGYELICDKYGTVSEDETPPDMHVDPRYKSLLKPGVLVSVNNNVVVAVWANQKAALPNSFMGMGMK